MLKYVLFLWNLYIRIWFLIYSFMEKSIQGFSKCLWGRTDRQTYDESNNHVLVTFRYGYTKRVMDGSIACIRGMKNAFTLPTGITRDRRPSQEICVWWRFSSLASRKFSSTAEWSWRARQQVQFVGWRPPPNRRPIIASRLLTASAVASGSKYREQLSSFFKWHSSVSLPEIPADYRHLGTKYWQTQ